MYFRPQIIAALFLANTMAVTSQQADSDPIAACSSIPFTSTLIGDGIYAYQLPFIEDCLASVPVDKDNMIQHISALNKVFAQTYAFYNVAKDPKASDPLNYQAKLGYSLFDSPEEGMVDIDAQLKSIIQSVEEEGATWATFWQVESVANRLRDGHVDTPDTNAGIHGLAFFPDRIADKTMAAKPSFWNDPVTKELKLKIQWMKVEEREFSESVVKTINNVSPYEFFLNVTNSPSIVNSLPYQSRGARFNALLRDLDKSASQLYFYQKILDVTISGRPSDAYPSEVQVKYEDGEEETYRSFLYTNAFSKFHDVSSSELGENGQTVSFNDMALQESINKQGSVSLEDNQVVQTAQTSLFSRERSLDVEGGDAMQFWDYRYKSTEDDPSPKLALKYMGDYAILKVEDFMLTGAEVQVAWSKLAAGAKERGIKKLIVDISNNDGGNIEGGKTLSQLMYPSLEEEVFINDFTAVINEPMQIFKDELAPLFEDLDKYFGGDKIFQNVTDSFTDDNINQVSAIIGSLRTFCATEDVFVKSVCEDVIGRLESDWASFVSDRIPAQSETVMRALMETMKVTDRLYFLAIKHLFLSKECPECGNQIKPLLDRVEEEQAFVADFKRVNLGGVPTNITNRLSYYTSAAYNAAAETATQADADFDEYIVLSNGAAGSASSMFASKVEQIWKNKDKSFVDTKLTTVSYGGLTENNGDVTMAGFAAHVEEINTEVQLIQVLVAKILDKYFLEWLDAETFAEFDSALDKFIDSVANTPYFSNTKPSFPVTAYYDNYMGPDAFPMQYIKMPADEHIPLHYHQTKIQDYGSLDDLYKQTAKFFSSDSVSASASDSSSAASVDPSSTASNDPSSAAVSVFTGTGILGAVIVAASAVMFL